MPVEWRAIVVFATLLLLPLTVWPTAATPFTLPKFWLIGAGTLTILLLTPRLGAVALAPSLLWLAALWTASFLVSAALADVVDVEAAWLGPACAALALAVARSGSPIAAALSAQAIGATLVALVALAQWLQIDPIALAGWRAPVSGASVRMRVYSTLGNPNSVGALMALSIGVTVSLAASARSVTARAAVMGGALVQMAALLATGSRGAVLGLAAGAVAWAAVRWSGRNLVALALVATFGAAAVVVSPARSLETTVAGRLYLWKLASFEASPRWLAGIGPGGFERRFQTWQRAAAAQGQRDVRFLGPTDHAHNDYVEALIERGLPGVGVLVGALVLAWRGARARARPVAPHVAAGLWLVFAGGACAMVDYPLARPVELTWWWLGLALVLARAPTLAHQSTDRT